MLEFIGQILLAGGGATALSLYFLKVFGDKWLIHQFSQQLESFKREQSELLEQYRYQINTRFNRITKIHEKEFEVLPEIWRNLIDTCNHFQDLTSPFQYFPNDLNHFSTEDLETFLEKCELNEFQKEKLRVAPDKFSYYQENVYWIKIGRATQALREFRNYLQYNKIFLSRDLFELFSEIEHVLIEADRDLRLSGTKPWTGGSLINKKLNEETKKLLDQVEDVVQKRLHFDQA